ncbi:hypothetical protein GTY75_05355 [Streptomyces sp. SID8381]|uniref:hypothetical protein n=1 Tax=unclassified Streptomyces TaxID=2593676 RepID=UPI00039D2BB2|nr:MULTISPECIES: hypothetical protein [unclassified Streptomyces]MYX26100.1 hypothetical protein [Streptomyces sp. SID8381]
MPWYIKAVLRIALPAACLAALYLSIPGEVALAKTAGWSEHYAPAMPVCLSVYALAAGAISQYRRKMQLPGERTALVGGVMALLLAMGAQSISHLIEQTYMGTSRGLVVAVSCVPPLVIAHLIHMAETPSQVKTASEEKSELRGMIDYLSVELTASLASQSLTLVSRASGVVREIENLSQTAEGLAGEFEKVMGEVEGLTEVPKPQALAARIAKTREALRAEGRKVTVDAVCKALNISQATYYRHKPSEGSQAAMLPLTA